MTEFKKLECKINDDYSVTYGLGCQDSPYISWIGNGQYTWTKSAAESDGNYIWTLNDSNGFSNFMYVYSYGIRPTITISKDIYESLVL